MNTKDRSILTKNTVWTILLGVGACFIYAIGAGIRSNYGVMLGFITQTSGLASTSVGFVLAAGQLVFGFVFFAHQIGSFFSAWLGGISIEMTGSYTLIWCASAVLCVLASVVSFCIRESTSVNQKLSI